MITVCTGVGLALVVDPFSRLPSASHCADVRVVGQFLALECRVTILGVQLGKTPACHCVCRCVVCMTELQMGTWPTRY